MDQYTIPLPNGRALRVEAEQLRRIATGFGDRVDQPADGGVPPLIRAISALPEHRRAAALNVAILRFGEKLDVESIAQQSGLSPWQVWELEEAIRRELAYARMGQSTAESALRNEPEASPPSRLVSQEMLSNAMAHGERVDLDREHEASRRAVRSLHH